MTVALNHSPADILRYVLIDLRCGSDPVSNSNWPIFVADEPDEPDNCITIYDTEGTNKGREMVGGVQLGYLGIQVRVRALNHKTYGHPRTNLIAKTLDEIIDMKSITIEGTTYIVEAFSRTGTVNYLGKDLHSTRLLYTINGTVTIRQKT